jgi:hypothetical protein
VYLTLCFPHVDKILPQVPSQYKMLTNAVIQSQAGTKKKSMVRHLVSLFMATSTALHVAANMLSSATAAFKGCNHKGSQPWQHLLHQQIFLCYGASNNAVLAGSALRPQT